MGPFTVQARESGTGLYEVSVTWCISTGRPLEGETILSE